MNRVINGQIIYGICYLFQTNVKMHSDKSCFESQHLAAGSKSLEIINSRNASSILNQAHLKSLDFNFQTESMEAFLLLVNSMTSEKVMQKTKFNVKCFHAFVVRQIMNISKSSSFIEFISHFSLNEPGIHAPVLVDASLKKASHTI